MLAQGLRFVEHVGAFALGLGQQVRGVQVFGVKGRVFAHQHGVKTSQGAIGHFLLVKPIVRITRQRDAA